LSQDLLSFLDGLKRAEIAPRVLIGAEAENAFTLAS
jgi:hypothetical protein